MVAKANFLSPICIKSQDYQIVVAATSNTLLGLKAETGELVWKHDEDYFAVTPACDDNKLFDGHNLLQLNQDSSSPTTTWTCASKVGIGHFVRIDNRLYATLREENKPFKLTCLNWNTGEVVFNNKSMPEANLITAEGLIYAYDSKGKVSLFEVSDSRADLVSSFRVRQGSGAHLAHTGDCPRTPLYSSWRLSDGL